MGESLSKKETELEVYKKDRLDQIKALFAEGSSTSFQNEKSSTNKSFENASKQLK